MSRRLSNRRPSSGTRKVPSYKRDSSSKFDEYDSDPSLRPYSSNGRHRAIHSAGNQLFESLCISYL